MSNILEKLADIEHQRWADWQKYLHSKCSTNSNGDLVIPAGYVKHLERQINTEYKNLTENEKESDRNEVKRYLPEILSLVEGCKIEVPAIKGTRWNEAIDYVKKTLTEGGK